jgi:group I intron endonuclease
MIIYKTTNLINGKFYDGQDINDDKNYYGSGVMILNAMKKYGKINFKKETLEKCSDIKELDEKEIFWIKELNVTNRKIGYNICEGGLSYRNMKGENNPMFGKHLSEETKQKIREKRKLQKMSDEQKQKLREKWSGDENPGKNKTPETIEKISQNRKGKCVGEEHPFFGKTHTKETKEKWSKIRKGKNIGIINPDATRYYIENPQGEELIFETRKSVMESLGCGLCIFNNKKWKGFKIIKKEKINR